jgi:MinD-like ATPase involved in chromosome partitioning or flagellar assembly
MHTFWVTFYSYKGGVGRSMALANVAADLAAKGRRVVMIDFDLEAPGLDAFEELNLKPGAPGLVEYVSEYLATDIAPPVSGFVQEITHKKAGRGNLWVLHAGRKDEEYNRLRAAINWEDLYDNRDGAAFFENFKADIQQQFQPDYVFVDSRTGLTDVGGVCTLHLPDLVVLLFSLNEQNLQGISSVARVLRDAENSPLLLPVATPVPNLPREKDGLLKERFERAKELLGVEIKHTISYSSLVSLKEQIITWTGPQRLQEEYQELARTIKSLNPQGLDYLLREADAALKNLESDRAQEISAALESEYPDRPDAWRQISEWRRMNRDIEGYEYALQKALDLNRNDLDVFRRLEALLVSQNRDHELLSLARRILDQDGELENASQRIIASSIGETSMRLGEYTEAAIAFRQVYSLSTRKDYDLADNELLVVMFNMLESRRKSGDVPTLDGWESLIQVFESSATGAGPVGIGLQLNRMQAMHIAYALAGNTSEAGKLLMEVNRLAVNASPRERVFSVATYRHMSREEFLRINNQMLDALAKGELWDGFKLP